MTTRSSGWSAAVNNHLTLLLERPLEGSIRCDQCGKFIAHTEIVRDFEYGDYGSVLSVGFFCSKACRRG